MGRVLFLADACAGAQRLCGAGRARAAAPAAHRRQRRGRRAVRGLRACTKPSAGGAGLRAYGPLCQPAVAGRDHSCVPAHPSAGAAMFALLSAGGDVGASLGRSAWAARRTGRRRPARCLRGRGESGALRAGLLLAAVFPLLCCGVHTALHCTEARGGLPAGSERRHRQ